MLHGLVEGIDRTETPGYCIGLLSNGSKPEFMFGGQCVQDGEPISADTLWETASLSKPVVALLTTDASDFGATDDARWSDLTLSHALTRTTGLPNWRPLGEPLSFEHDLGSPGYSGEGFELVLVELAARLGLPTEILLDHHIQRLLMPESRFPRD